MAVEAAIFVVVFMLPPLGPIPDPMRRVSKGQKPGKKKPHGVSGGAGFLFFSKEVTAYSITGTETFLL